MEFPDPPFRLPEANVQAEFYHWCRLLGCNCVLEMRTPAGRIDVAILDDQSTRLLCIVECKREGRRHGISETCQIRRYKTIGVPVFGLDRRDKAEKLVRQILRDYVTNTQYDGISIKQVRSMAKVPRSRKNRVQA